jgi:hypothetical protein
MTDYPITPPPELVQQWWHEAALRKYNGADADKHVTSMAAQWGADQELEACCEWLSVPCPSYGRELRNARRPKPPSLKEQAMQVLLEAGLTLDGRMELEPEDIRIIRRALEQLND